MKRKVAGYRRCRFALVLCVLVMIFVAAACGKKQSGGKDPNQTSGQTTPPAVSAGALDGTDLAARSSQYAEQIAAGLMEQVWEHFTDSLAEQMPLYNLQASWDGVVAGARGFQGVERVEEGESDGRQSVLVVLRYAGGQGRTIQFIYDDNREIAGIWFDTVRLEASESSSGAVISGIMDYEEKEMIIGREPYLLDGILTHPVGITDCPVVILLGDGMDLDMDGTVGEAQNRPLQDLAFGLAKKGIASLRYHMRGYQYSRDLSGNSSIYHLLLEDVGYAVTRLYNETGVNREQIYLAAMGMSGEYVPAMVADKPKRLAGAILMGTRPVAFSQSYFSEKEKGKSVTANPSYFVEENSTFPLLMMQGEADCDTSMEDFEQWKVLWEGRSHITYRSFHQLNHYFMRTTGALDHGDYDVEGEVSSEVIQTMADWISGRKG